MFSSTYIVNISIYSASNGSSLAFRNIFNSRSALNLAEFECEC